MQTHASHPEHVPASRPRGRPRYLEAPGKSALAAPDVVHEQIERRAYELYLARGERPGDALGDWLAAERELRAGGSAFPPLAKRTDSDLPH